MAKNIKLKTKTNICKAICRAKERLKAVEMYFLRCTSRISTLNHIWNEVIRKEQVHTTGLVWPQTWITSQIRAKSFSNRK